MDETKIRQHAAFVSLKQLQEAKTWPEIPSLTANPAAAWQWQRFLHFLTLIEDLFASTPMQQLSMVGLDALNSVFQNCYANLSAFRTQQQQTYLDQALSYIETTGYQHLWAFGPTSNSKAFPKKLIDELVQHAQQTIAMLSAERLTQETAIAGLRDEVTDVRKELTAAKKRIDAEQVRVAAVSDEGRAQFAKTVNDLTAKFETNLNQYGSAFSSLSDDATKALDQLTTNAHAKTNALIQKIESKHEEAKNLVGLVGDTATTGNYQITAKTETGQANTWRWITLGVFAAAGVMGGWALIDLARNSVSWELAVVRVLFGFLIGAIALYTGSESARHRTTADRAKRIELELASLGPFLGDLPKEKQVEIRQKLADKYFANESNPHVANSIVSTKDVLSLADKSIDTLKKIVGK